MACKRTQVTIPEPLLLEVDALVGKRSRSAFLVDLLTRELRRQRLINALSRGEPAWKDEDHPELREGAAAWVDSLRAEESRRLDEKLADRASCK